VTHLFYRINRTVWQGLQPAQSTELRDRLQVLCDRYNQPSHPRLCTYANIGGKADLGFIIYAADLVELGRIHREVEAVFPPGALATVFTYLSVTELSEYTTTEAESEQNLIHQEKLDPESDLFKQRLAEVRERLAKYEHYRLYPEMQDWELMGFYPMSKRRAPGENWYVLDFPTRKKLMGGHARVGRKYAGRVSQLITGSTGLDDWEWGVTLMAHQADALKEIVYEMRFDEVSARYGEFGPFYVNLRLPPAGLWAYLGL
jgi:peroxiredoxin